MFSAGFRKRRLMTVLAGLIILTFPAASFAQDQDKKDSDEPGAAQGTKADPLKRPITEKQKKANARSLRQELSKTYKKWLDEDVRWIITDCLLYTSDAADE